MTSWKARIWAYVYSFVADKWYSLNVTTHYKENKGGLDP